MQAKSQFDWNMLNEKANNFRMLSEVGKDVAGRVVTADRSGKHVDITFCGLTAKLSELLSGVKFGAHTILTVFADTLVIDMECPAVHGGVIAVRCLNVAPLKNGLLRFILPDKEIKFQILAMEISGGPLRVVASPSAADEPGVEIPAGLPFRIGYLTLKNMGKPTLSVIQGNEHLQDVLENPWHLNSLRSSFVAATWLMDEGDEHSRKLALSMLGWIVEGVASLRAANPELPADWSELYTQSAALLITLDLPPNTYHVPVLAGDVYQSQVKGLTKALGKYEGNLKALSGSADIKQALADIGASFKDVTGNEVAPFQFQLKNIKDNISHIDDNISTLQQQYLLHKSDAEVNLSLLKAEVDKMKAIQTIETSVQMAAAIYTVLSYPSAMANAALTSGGKGLSHGQIIDRSVSGTADLMQKTIKKETTAAALEALKNGYKLYELNTSNNPAKEFIQKRIDFTQLLAAALELWRATLANETSAGDIVKLTANVIDPEGDWSRFMSYIKLEMDNMKKAIGTGTASSSAQVAANKYQFSLENMASYARAIDTKLVALATLMAQGAVLLSQIRATENSAKRWEQLKSSAVNEAQQIALLKSMQQSRIDSIKRSVFAAWSAYRNAYFYLKFKQPPVVLRMEMDGAQMADAMQNAELWVNQALENSASGEVTLPSKGIDIDLVFDICKQGESRASKGESRASKNGVAYLFTDGKGMKTLTWNISHGDKQLARLLPNNGKVAIWVKEATFKLEGLQTSRENAVVAKVGTSGMYDNGVGESGVFHFLAKKIVGNYGYYESKTHMPWKIDACTYMTPTPFTMWSMTFEPNSIDPSSATQLNMNLKISILEKA